MAGLGTSARGWRRHAQHVCIGTDGSGIQRGENLLDARGGNGSGGYGGRDNHGVDQSGRVFCGRHGAFARIVATDFRKRRHRCVFAAQPGGRYRCNGGVRRRAAYRSGSGAGTANSKSRKWTGARAGGVEWRRASAEAAHDGWKNPAAVPGFGDCFAPVTDPRAKRAADGSLEFSTTDSSGIRKSAIVERAGTHTGAPEQGGGPRRLDRPVAEHAGNDFPGGHSRRSRRVAETFRVSSAAGISRNCAASRSARDCATASARDKRWTHRSGQNPERIADVGGRGDYRREAVASAAVFDRGQAGGRDLDGYV